MVQGALQKETQEVNKNERVKKDISLCFDFIRYLIKNPEMLNRIPDNAEVDFLETDLPTTISEAEPPALRQGVLFKVEHVFEEVNPQ
jgi:hypothetical protein